MLCLISNEERGWNVKWQIGLGCDFHPRGAADNAILLYIVFAGAVNTRINIYLCARKGDGV